jgi:hypothetical protein
MGRWALIICNVSGTEKALEGLVPLNVGQVCRQVSGVPSTYYSLIRPPCIYLSWVPKEYNGAPPTNRTHSPWLSVKAAWGA